MENANMKTNPIRFAALLSALLLGFCLSGASDAAAQAQIKTRRVRISDFTTKTTKVVLRGEDDLLSSAIVSEVTSRWRLSPYEFCDTAEYGQLKSSSDYYFLLLTGGSGEGGSGILSLTLVKGGKEQDPDPSKESLTLVRFPLCSAEKASGRELALLPAAIDIIQDFTYRAMLSDKNAYSNLTAYSARYAKRKVERIVFAPEDVSGVKSELLGGGISVCEEADEVFETGEEGTLVSFIVAPPAPAAGGQFCYKMLIDAGTHELHRFRRERIKGPSAVTYTNSEVRKLRVRLR